MKDIVPLKSQSNILTYDNITFLMIQAVPGKNPKWSHFATL